MNLNSKYLKASYCFESPPSKDNLKPGQVKSDGMTEVCNDREIEGWTKRQLYPPPKISFRIPVNKWTTYLYYNSFLSNLSHKYTCSH